MAVACVATLASGALAQDRETERGNMERKADRSKTRESRWERRRKKGRVWEVIGVQGSNTHAPAFFDTSSVMPGTMAAAASTSVSPTRFPCMYG